MQIFLVQRDPLRTFASNSSQLGVVLVRWRHPEIDKTVGWLPFKKMVHLFASGYWKTRIAQKLHPLRAALLLLLMTSAINCIAPAAAAAVLAAQKCFCIPKFHHELHSFYHTKLKPHLKPWYWFLHTYRILHEWGTTCSLPRGLVVCVCDYLETAGAAAVEIVLPHSLERHGAVVHKAVNDARGATRFFVASAARTCNSLTLRCLHTASCVGADRLYRWGSLG